MVPYDVNRNIDTLLTQSFVHMSHILKSFGYYYPPEIENWYVDDWITNIYDQRSDKRIKVRNSGGPPRYKVNNDKKNYLNILRETRPKLEKFLNLVYTSYIEIYKSNQEEYFISENFISIHSNRVTKFKKRLSFSKNNLIIYNKLTTKMSRRKKIINLQNEKYKETLFRDNKLEEINKNFNIGVIIPTTSNKKNYKQLEDYVFFQITLPSFLKTCSNINNYNFYMGYDDDDIFFEKNKSKLIELFNKLTEDNYTINFYPMENLKGKVGKIWSNLADIAKEKNEYLYQIGDDIKILDENWDLYFIDRLRKSNNFGCVGPYDINIKNYLLTQSFVHIKHLDIFSTYFPDEIINWDIDLWITQVYGANPVFGINIDNTSRFGERYTPVSDKENYIKIRDRDTVKLGNFFQEKNILNINYLPEEKKYKTDGIKLTIGIPTLKKRRKLLTRLINKISWCSWEYKDKIEIIILEDEGEITIGEKRNKIVEKSEGEYFCFIDDDDLISDNYFELIFDSFKNNPDGVGFKGMYYEKEFSKLVFSHNYDNKTHFKKNSIQERPLNHLNPIKTSLVKQIKYKEINFGEDFDFTNRIVSSIKSGNYIDYILYHYLYDPQK